MEIKSEEVEYGKKGPAHDKFDYSKARYIHADGSVCRAEQQKHAEKEMQLPDLPDTNGKTASMTSPTATDTCTDLNAEATTRQDLPVEMTTALKSKSLTVETTDTTVTKVHEEGASSAADNMNTGLNVEMSPENNLDILSETIDAALNVETELSTNKDGPVTGLNVETSPKDNTKQLSDSEDAALNVETEPSVNMEGPMTQELKQDLPTDRETQPTGTDLNHKWQEDIEHLTDITTELNRTDAAIGLLLLNSLKSTHIDTEEEELENELLMPIGGEKQPDIVSEMEQQNGKKTGAMNDPTTLANATENQEEIDSDATLVLDIPDERTKNQESRPKPKKRTSNGTLVIRSYKLRCKTDNTLNQKNKQKLKLKFDSGRKKQNESGQDSRLRSSISSTDKYKIKRTKQNGITYYHCGYCTKVFDSLQHLNNHHKRNHNSVTCDVCNKQFATPNTLIRHAYGHLTKQYGCELCDQTF